MIGFLTPSFYQSRYHSIADDIIYLLMPDLIDGRGKNHITFPRFQVHFRQESLQRTEFTVMLV